MQLLTPWHDFYTVLGEASATLTGLLFVAASVGSGVFSGGRPGALRMFLSASVVQFASILVGCLCVLAPLGDLRALGGLVGAVGVFGVGYSAMAWREAVRDGVMAKVDLEDRVWYALAPAVGYLLVTGAGVALGLQNGLGCAGLAAAMGLLLLVAVHNAWDITIWSVTRRRE